MPEITVSQGLLERAIAVANASDERDRQYRAEQAAQHRQWEIDFAQTTAARVFGEAAEGAAYEYLDAQEPYEPDRVIVTIEGQWFEYDGQVNPPALRHLVLCPSLLHPKVEMRSDPISSLYDLGEIRRAPEGRYHCAECSRVEYETEERLDAESAKPPALPAENLPTRTEALLKVVEFAERAEDPGAETRAERLAAITAYAALSQAWGAIAIARTIDDHAGEGL